MQKLRAIDTEVRAHEQAHQAVGGQFAGSPSFEFERGPDGNRFAVSGEVPIRLPTGDGDPERRLRQADQVIRAALAPAEPSAQDRSVAARAQQIKSEAQAEIQEERTTANSDDDSASPAAESDRRAIGNFVYPAIDAEAATGAQLNTQA